MKPLQSTSSTRNVVVNVKGQFMQRILVKKLECDEKTSNAVHLTVIKTEYESTLFLEVPLCRFDKTVTSTRL